MQTLAQPRAISCYDNDWVLWIDAQVRLLSERRFSDLDIENLVEELDGMKKQYAHELDSRLTVLIMHLLKCEYQTDHARNKWHSTLIEQRRRISLLLASSPSMRQRVLPFALDCYADARRRAAVETRLNLEVFPAQLPYSTQQLLDPDFMP
ncbi:DUF29 family protein [Pseudoduganella sp. FT25W]|jgi:hypothetical protein|uniref:DUF29 family protein n=1 Tax=Duganella alba TaxID=2666081 RepID=A0A6L5Q8W6_9BURK|nr:DUF29 domain-containing protein [Duganella alba]MRX06263.1 DUF29 family protein [Duganella alba]MRX14657.1 DUF29 family protein [Duganella alba]